MSIEVAVRVNERGELQIPEEIQRQLFPGMVVVLKLDEQEHTTGERNGHTDLSFGADGQSGIAPGPELVEKNGWIVVRGQLPSNFDWDLFMQSDREERLSSLTEWVEG